VVDLRDWARETFGGTGEELLDASVYSNEDLRKDIIKLEDEQKRLEKKMDNHRRQYKALINEGAEASEMKRKKLAQKAKMEKKKLAVQKKKYDSNTVKLGIMLSVQGMREILDESQDVANLEFDEVMDDTDAQQIQSKVMERMASFGVEMEHIQEIGDALDVPIMEGGMDVDTSEEEELMTEFAAGQFDVGDLDVAPEATLDPDLGPSFDADVDDLGLDVDEPDFALEEAPLVEPVVREVPEHGLLEVDLEREDERLASLTLDDDGYAARWTQAVSIEDVLEWVTADDGVADDPKAEAFFRGGETGDPERVTASLSAVREDERFPDHCGFLAVAGDVFELAWEDDEGVDGAEVTVSVDGTSPEPFRRTYRRRDGLSHDELAAVLGRAEDFFEAGVDDE
jgi:hypothetical protein